MSLIISYLSNFFFIIIYLIIKYLTTFSLIAIIVKGYIPFIMCMLSANSNLCRGWRWSIICYLSTFFLIIISLIIKYISALFLIKIIFRWFSVVFWVCLVPIITCAGSYINTFSTIVVFPYSLPRYDWTKNIDLWFDKIESSPSSRNGLLVLSLSQYFLEDILELFCERNAPIILSAGAVIHGVSTIVVGWHSWVLRGPGLCTYQDRKIWLFFIVEKMIFDPAAAMYIIIIEYYPDTNSRAEFIINSW